MYFLLDYFPPKAEVVGSNPTGCTNVFCVANDGSLASVAFGRQAFAQANAERAFDISPLERANVFCEANAGSSASVAFDRQAFACANADRGLIGFCLDGFSCSHAVTWPMRQTGSGSKSCWPVGCLRIRYIPATLFRVEAYWQEWRLLCGLTSPSAQTWE